MRGQRQGTLRALLNQKLGNHEFPPKPGNLPVSHKVRSKGFQQNLLRIVVVVIQAPEPSPALLLAPEDAIIVHFIWVKTQGLPVDGDV